MSRWLEPLARLSLARAPSALGVALVVLVLAIGPSSALAESVMVHVGHNKLDPSEVTISLGDQIIFHNMDAMPGGHTVVLVDGSLSSGPLEVNDIWKHTFEEPGIFEFKIEQHPDARTTITVEETVAE